MLEAFFFASVLPSSVKMNAPVPTTSSEASASDPPNRKFGPLRILVAHQSQRSCANLLGALTACCVNLDLRIVTDAQRLFEVLGSHEIDCALIDSGLPGFQGGKILDEMRRLGIETPAIFMTDDRTAHAQSAGYGPTSGEAWGIPTCLVWDEIDARRLAAALEHSISPTAPNSTSSPAQSDVHSLAPYRNSDLLTGLPGRAMFLECLRYAISNARAVQELVGLLIFDFYDFKSVNRNFGYSAGDHLLESIGRKLSATVGPDAMLARIGNDEFAILLTTGVSLEVCEELARQALLAAAEPISIDGRSISPRCTIGVAIHPAHGGTAENLLVAAEIALRSARRSGSNLGVFGDGETSADADRVTMAQDLQIALENNQLELYYQPKIDLTRRCVVGVEALLRWKHPSLGFVSPELFVPLAEQTGLIDQLTQWVLSAALRQMKCWHDLHLDFRVSVNLSALTLHDLSFPAIVAAELNKWQVEPHRLVLEVTESAIILDSARAIEIISRLDAMGMMVSVDDFGTGYTSLAYIRRLPIREIKIDKSFILNMRDNADDAVIVRTIIELGHSLGLEVVAEGIEDDVTFELLRALNCDLGQGYFMGRPVPVEALERWLAESPWRDGRMGRDGQIAGPGRAGAL
jgi:diguanylate cyclase (GGDEF)-like protein